MTSPTIIVSSFWYHRLSEITLLVSAVILLLFASSYFSAGFNATLDISLLAAILAAATVIISIAAYFVRTEQLSFPLAFAAYMGLVLTAGTIVIETGNTGSPFIALWMLAAVFSGLFGILGLITLTVLSSGYLVYLLTAVSTSREELIMFSLAFGLPIIISYIIWHKKNTHENEKDRAFSKLASELSHESNKSDIVIGAIADGVIAIDNKGIVQLINPAAQRILGWNRSDAINLDYRSVIKLENNAGEPIPEDIDPIRLVMGTGNSSLSEDFSMLTNSGKKFLASLMVSPSGQNGSGAIIVFRDITEAKSEERQQAEFISTASHEMRTPVAAIEGYLGLALNPNTATIDEKARTYLTKAHESAQHLGRLFQDLLDVSRAEDGRLKNEPTVVDVISLARDITNSLMPSASAKGLVLLYRPDAPSIGSNTQVSPVFYSHIDQDHFREVLANLIENAIKYTNKGDVVVDVEGDEDMVHISVRDTGIGVPAEDIPHLFQKFYRVDSTDTREIGGTGLGLYLSRRLVEAMQGKIRMESEYHKGSTFFMSFPRISHEDAMSKIEEQTHDPSAIPIVSLGSAAQTTAVPVPQTTPLATAPQQPTTQPSVAPPVTQTPAQPPIQQQPIAAVPPSAAPQPAQSQQIQTPPVPPVAQPVQQPVQPSQTPAPNVPATPPAQPPPQAPSQNASTIDFSAPKPYNGEQYDQTNAR